MCIFVIFMTQCDWLRCRRQQHKLSWSYDFQYSWWSRLTRWNIIGDHHTSKSPSKGRQILRVSKQWGTWQGEVLIMSRTCRLLCFSQASIPTTLLPFKKGDCATGPDPMCMTNERCTRGSRLKLWKEKLLRFHPQLSNCLRIVQTKSIKDATAYCHYQRGFLNIFNINCICCIIYISLCTRWIHPSRHSVLLFASNATNIMTMLDPMPDAKMYLDFSPWLCVWK